MRTKSEQSAAAGRAVALSIEEDRHAARSPPPAEPRPTPARRRRLRRPSARSQARPSRARPPTSRSPASRSRRRLRRPAASYCTSPAATLRGAGAMTGKATPRRAKSRAQRRAGPARRDAGAARARRRGGPDGERGADKLRRLVDPFDVMRSTRALAPHDPRLNDIRWLIGEALRRLHRRADLDALRAVAADVVGAASARARAPACRRAKSRFTRATSCAPPRSAPAPPPGRSLTRIVIEGAPLERLPPPACPKSSRRGAPTRSSPTACASGSIGSASWSG